MLETHLQLNSAMGSQLLPPGRETVRVAGATSAVGSL